MFIDTHTHLMDDRFDGKRQEILGNLQNDGLKYIISVGYDTQSSQSSYDYSVRYEGVYGAAAVHPHDSRLLSDGDFELFRRLLKHPKMVAVGETGLDYHYDYSPREVQRAAFIRHMELAFEMQLPIIIHLRDAFGDMLDILLRHQELLKYGGVLHCYSGSADMAKRFLDLGLYISFAGAVTFKNAGPLLNAVMAVPLDRILTETDCPYITPVPHRGQLNYPKYVKYTAEKIAMLKGIDTARLNTCVDENCRRLFTRIV